MAQGYFPCFNISFRDANGDPLANGKVYFFLPDGVTPAPTYNQNGQANPHPVVLGVDGEAQIKGDDTISYTVKSYTSTNSLVDTWVGVYIPSGGSGSTVTMDTISQGTNFKKLSTTQYNALTSGASTTLHYHSADRSWGNLTGVPSTFTPSTHASSHQSGGSDAVDHNLLTNATLANTGVSKGHISDGAQNIYGAKTFKSALTVGQNDGVYTVTVLGDQGSSIAMQAGSNISSVVTTGEVIGGTDVVAATLEASRQSSYAAVNVAAGTFGVQGITTTQYAYLSVTNGGLGIFLWPTMIRQTRAGGIIQNYQLPESSSGTYNVATREWVAANYSAIFPAYVHTQDYAVNTWTINHGFSYFPVIQCWNSSGQVVEGAITHYEGYSTVYFAVGQCGGARCI